MSLLLLYRYRPRIVTGDPLFTSEATRLYNATRASEVLVVGSGELFDATKANPNIDEGSADLLSQSLATRQGMEGVARKTIFKGKA